MLGGWTPIGTLPLATLPAVDDASVPSLLPALLNDPDAFLVFVLRVEPLNLTGNPSSFPYPVASQPVASLDSDDLDQIETLYFSSHPLATAPTDTPASRNFPPRLIEPYSFESSIPFPASGTGLGSAGFGDIVLLNDDGALDYLLERSWEGREAIIYIGGTYNRGRYGEVTLSWNQYEALARCIIEGIRTQRNRIILSVRDPFAKLDTLVQRTRYAGTGDLEGGASIEGVVKPLTWGEGENARGVPVDPAYLVYQLHDGSMQAINEVRDQGVALTYDGDIVGLALASVYDWTPVAGHWISDLANGILRLGASPTGLVTADFEGDDEGGYVNTTSEILRRIVARSGGLLDPDEIDVLSFDAFEDHGVSGFYTDTKEYTIEAIANDLIMRAYGWVVFTRLGKLRIGAHLAPENQPILEELTDDFVEDVDLEHVPSPIWQVIVGYAPMWAVQDADALAGSVSASDRARYSQQFRTKIAENYNTRARHFNAREFRLDSLLSDASDAEDLAELMITRGSVRRRGFALSTRRLMFRRQPGDIVRLKLSRCGLDAGLPVVARRIEEIAAADKLGADFWG